MSQSQLGDSASVIEQREAVLEEYESILKSNGNLDTINRPRRAYEFFKGIEYRTVGGQQLAGNCMFCNVRVISCAATRLVAHLCSCPLTPVQLRNTFKTLVEQTSQKRKAKEDHMTLVNEEAEREAHRVKAEKILFRQQGIKEGFKAVEAQAADEAIASFFCSNGLSFAAAASQADSTYRAMVRAIQAAPPSYVPPNRNALATKLLDRLDEKIEQQICARDPDGLLAEKFGIAYTQDGWDSVDHLPLINSAYVTANDGGVYLRSIDTSGETKTAEYIAAMMVEDIYKIGCSKVIVVVTDTCSTMTKAWKKCHG